MTVTYSAKWEEPFKVFSVGHYFVYDRYLWRIVNIDFLKYKESGTVGANTETAYQDMTVLEPEEGQMYGFIIGVKGPVLVNVKQPLAVTKWGTAKLPVGEITEIDSPYEDPDPSTFIVTLKDKRFARRIKNPLDEEAEYKIKYVGYKYEIKPLARILALTSSGAKVQYLTTDFPRDVIMEKVKDWLRGRIPELTTTGFKR